MFARPPKSVLLGSIAAAAALGLGFAVAHAQPYDNGPAYGDEQPSTTGGLTVYAPRHHYRTWSGAPIVRVRASRVVDASDLDLSTGWGMHELRNRVERAAADACDSLDRQWTRGLYPLADDSDADCYVNAVDDAMSQVEPAY